MGRTFTAAEQVIGAPHVAVIGYGLWQRAFGGDPAPSAAASRGGIAPTIIGIMPRGFSYPEKVEMWLPITSFGDPGTRFAPATTGAWWAGSRPGVSMEQAQADIGTIERRIKGDTRRLPIEGCGSGFACKSTWWARCGRRC